jgi:hypothetical protein
MNNVDTIRKLQNRDLNAPINIRGLLRTYLEALEKLTYLKPEIRDPNWKQS